MPMDFDSGDYYSQPDDAIRLSGASMSAHMWVKRDSSGPVYSGCWAGGSAYYWLMQVATGGAVSLGVSGSTIVTSGGTVPVDTWTSVGVSFASASRGRTYLDGTQTEAGSGTTIGSGMGSDANFEIGRAASAVYSDAKIAHFAVWNAELTQGEFDALAAGAHPLTVRPSALVSYWPLNSDAPTVDDTWFKRALTSVGSPTAYTADEPTIDPRPPAPIQFKGFSNNSGTPGSPRSVTFDDPVTAGSLIVVVVSRYCNFAVRQAGVVTDDAGGSYAQVESPGSWYDAGNTDFQMFVAENHPGGTTEVICTWTGTGSGYEQMIAVEVPGVATSSALTDSEIVDTETTASTTPVVGTVTPGAAGDLLVAASQTSSWAVNPGVSGDWAKIADVDDGLAIAWQVAPSTSDVSGTWTLSGADEMIGGVAAFAAAAGFTLDTVLPDADIVTTGWTTAPLYSKVNDASDASVITATAS